MYDTSLSRPGTLSQDQSLYQSPCLVHITQNSIHFIDNTDDNPPMFESLHPDVVNQQNKPKILSDMI